MSVVSSRFAVGARLNRRRKRSSASAAKAVIDFATVTARLKPRPFKAKSEPEFFRKPCFFRELTGPATRLALAPTALLAVGGGNDQGFVVRLGGVMVDCGCSLGAEVAGLRFEIERAYAVRTLGAGELHAVLDALDAVGFH